MTLFWTHLTKSHPALLHTNTPRLGYPSSSDDVCDATRRNTRSPPPIMARHTTKWTPGVYPEIVGLLTLRISANY